MKEVTCIALSTKYLKVKLVITNNNQIKSFQIIFIRKITEL